RTAVRSAGDQLSLGFNDTSSSLIASRRDVSSQIALKIPEVNGLAERIGTLNAQIASVLAQGDTPNDLLDERDRLLDQVVKLTGATYRQEGDGTTTVLLGGHALVTADRVNRLVTDAQNLSDGTQIHRI